MTHILTKEEKHAIAQLKKLVNSWPDSLWLFSTGILHVMRKDSSGHEACLPSGGVDPDYVVWSTGDILSEGGGW